jgi:hypothetical protein
MEVVGELVVTRTLAACAGPDPLSAYRAGKICLGLRVHVKQVNRWGERR